MLDHLISLKLLSDRDSAAARSPNRTRLLGCLALVLLVLAGPLAQAATPEDAASCTSDRGRPQLHVVTELGTVVVELFDDAAPESLGQLYEQLTGPSDGVFDGATFDYTSPHRELHLTRPPGSPDVTIDVQIDAAALGLDDRKISTVGEAMDTLQRELLPAFAKNGKRVDPDSHLKGWLEEWYQDRDPSFLVGVSRREINEALGYRYERGLASRPAERGMVALRPKSPTEATPGLSFLLCDMPERTGRWMVVGRVVEGLDLLEEIALLPRAPGMAGFKYHRPAKPIAAQAVHLRCDRASSSAPAEDRFAEAERPNPAAHRLLSIESR